MQFPAAKSPGREGTMRTSVLAMASPCRPTAPHNTPSAKTPERKKGSGGIVQDRAAQLTEELKQSKAMYRKMVEAHSALRADFRASEEQCQALGQRAKAAECHAEVLKTTEVTTTPEDVSPKLKEQREAAKQARRDTQVLWQAVAANVDAAVLEDLRKVDVEARVTAEVDLERQRCVALWDALRKTVDAAAFAAIARNVGVGTDSMCPWQQTALPVCLARRLFEASESLKPCEGSRSETIGTPSSRLSTGGPRASDTDNRPNRLSTGCGVPKGCANANNADKPSWRVSLGCPLSSEGEKLPQRLSTSFNFASEGDKAPEKLSTGYPRMPPPMPSMSTSSAAERRLSVSGTVGIDVPPPMLSTSSVAERRLSLPGTGGADVVTGNTPREICATPGKARKNSIPSIGQVHKDPQTPDMTPAAKKQGFVIVTTPRSASVRDRILALESNGKGD